MWGARPAHPPHHRPRHQPQFPHQRLPANAGEHTGTGSRAHPWVLAARGDGVAWSQHLPVEEEYVPPIRLRVLDTQGFGFRPHLGQACVQDLARFRREPNGEKQLPQPRVPVSGFNAGTTLSHLHLAPAPSLPIHALSLGPSTPSLSLPHPSHIPVPSLSLPPSRSYSYPIPVHPFSVPHILLSPPCPVPDSSSSLPHPCPISVPYLSHPIHPFPTPASSLSHP